MTGMVWRWAVLAALLILVAQQGHANTFEDGIPADWICEGTCGTGVANGVVSLAPSGGDRYGWVATTGSPLRSLGLPGIGGTNGSRLRSPVFTAREGESLEFQFNYVTSDGAGYADYAWARLLDASLQPVALLFTARTRSSGNIVPGFGMPEIAAEINPPTVNIIGGGPRWSPLGGDSGRCFSSGCGYTDWVDSRYVIPETGDYVLEFGVVNWSDTLYQSGLAFDGVMIGGKPIGADPDYSDVRIIARLAGSGIRVEADSFAIPPHRVEEAGGRIELEWYFESFSVGQLEALDYQVTVEDPLPGEARPVVEEVVISYRDLLGAEHQRVLGPLTVEVLQSFFVMEIATDRPAYRGGDPVAVRLEILNQGSAASMPGIEWEIRDAAGHRVALLPDPGEILFEAGETRVFTVPAFDTTGLYAGDYAAVARLSDPIASSVIEATAGFRIGIPSDTGLVAAITTDRPAYDPHDTVTLSASLENTAPNLQLTGHQATLSVLDPSGIEIWRADVVPGDLLPGGLQELVRQMGLGAAAPGDYRAQLVVRDADGTVLALAEAGFRVRSTSETGAGLIGAIVLAPDPVLRSERLYLDARVTNHGNDALNHLPVVLTLVDPRAGQELASWGRVMNLGREETHSVVADTSVDVPAGTVLVAVLQAEIQGEFRTLSTASVRVQDRFVSSPSVEGRGRLLVLLDPPGAQECIAVERLDLRLATGGALTFGDRLQVELYDVRGRLLDSETWHGGDALPVDLSQGTGGNLRLTGISGQGMGVTIDIDSGGPSAQDRFHLMATLHRDGFTRQLTSGAIPAGCVQLPEPGAALGDFSLLDASIRAEGPSVQRRAFLETLLQGAGWSYTMVDNRYAFATQLRRGGHAAFLLLSDRVPLETQVARELREAVFAGRGIVMGGAKDHRNHHLLEVFGAEMLGAEPHAVGIGPLQPAPIAVPDGLFPGDGPAVELRLHDGIAVAQYRSADGGLQDAAAVSIHGFGKGRSLLAGFDLLAQAKAGGGAGPFASLLLDALEFTHPDPALRQPGMTVPVRWALNNRGAAGSVRLDLTVIGGSIADPGTGRLEGTDAVSWDIDLAADSETELLFWWQLPLAPEQAQIIATLDLQDGALPTLYDISFHDLPIEPLPWFSGIREGIQAQQGFPDQYSQALAELDHAQAKYEYGHPAKAVFHLLHAADWLAEIADPAAGSLRESLAWLIHRLASEI
jgi:hypothetical protein